MLKPLANRVLIKPNYRKETSLGGLIIPKHLQERNSCGVVVAVGRGSEKKPMQYEVGQTIHHIKGAGLEVIENDEKFYLIDDIDILAFSNN